MCSKTLVSLLVLERWWLLATSPLYRSRWRDRMETLSTSSAFCEGIQQALEQTAQQLIVWDVMKHMWRHSHTSGNRPAIKPIKDVHIVTSWRREAFRITQRRIWRVFLLLLHNPEGYMKRSVIISIEKQPVTHAYSNSNFLTYKPM